MSDPRTLLVETRIPRKEAWFSRFLVSIGLLLAAATASAQDLEFFWTQTGGGRFTDWAHVELDPNGNVVVAGAITHPAEFAGRTLATPDGNFQDILVAKLGPDGSFLWANSSGGTLMDAATDVDVNSSGQILIGGFFRDPFDFFGGPRMTADGHRDVFSALFEPDGTLSWVKRGGGPERDGSGAVRFDRSGNALATGRIRAGGDFDGTRASASFAGSGYLVTQRPASGDVTSLRTFTDSGVWAVETMPDGGTVIAGEFYGWTDFGTGFPVAPSGLTDAFVARYDAAGGLVYARTFGGSTRRGLDASYGLASGPDGRVFVTGAFSGDLTLPGDLVLSSAPAEREEYHDGFIVCFEADGTPCWARRFGGPRSDAGFDVEVSGDGSIAVVGSVGPDAQFATRTLAGAGDGDGFVARYDASTGALLSLMSFGGSGRDGVEDVVIDDVGDLYVSGYFADTVRFGETLATAVDLNLFVSKIIVADDVAEDPFEDDDTPASATRITTDWEHSHRCPAWLARRLRSDDDTCEGIFANGLATLPDGSQIAPPRGAEQVWSMTISGRTLTRDADFYRVAVPDPGSAEWGPEHASIYAGSPPGIDEPLPECGSTVRESIGPTGRNNNVNVNMTGRFRISIVPAEDHTVTGRGVRPDEPILVYDGTLPVPEIVNRDLDIASVDCPRTLHGLEEIVFSIGERARRSEFNMGEYDVELEYVVEITRGVPDWAFDPSRFYPAGFLPDFAAPERAGPITVLRNFPTIRDLLDNCIADGPGCWEIFNVAWAADRPAFELDISATPGMQFRLLDADQNVLAESAVLQDLTRLESLGFEQQRLVAEQLPAGVYYLAAGGTPGTYSLAYESVGALPPTEMGQGPGSPSNRPWLLLAIGLLAIVVLGVLFLRRQRR